MSMIIVLGEQEGLMFRVIFTVRRYASTVYAVAVCPSVRHKPVLYRND